MIWRNNNIINFFPCIAQLIGTNTTGIYSSPLNPYTTLATLSVVLAVTSLKEGYEDLQRARYSILFEM
jgi:hypothetical protein